MVKWKSKNFSLICRLFCLLLLASTVQSASAIIIEDLYSVELKAQDKTDIERKGLLLTGFDQVLLKLTNDSAVATATQIQIAKEQIDKYVTSFSYNNDLQVKIIFNETMVNTLLKTAGISYLGKQRPMTIVWLVIDAANGAKLISEDDNELFVTKLEQTAALHAVPLMLPLLDLEERAKIKVDDVLGRTAVFLAETIKNYNADIVLIGEITNFAGEYRGRWHILGNAPVEWEIHTATIDEQYTQLMHNLKTQLINRYVVVDAPKKVVNNVVKLKVSEVNSLENYAKILTYLRNLNAMHLVEVAEITTTSVTFALHIDGGEEAVKKAISMDTLLEQENNEAIQQDQKELHYKVRL